MKYLCKDCWRTHEPATLLARCHECDLRTQVSRLDPLQSMAAGGGVLSGGQAELVCRLHRKPLELFCDRCKNPVPPRAIVGERSIMAILGDTASGKTSLLWVVTDRLRESNGGGVAIRRAVGKSDEQLLEAVGAMFEGGRLQPTTATDANVRNYAWELTLPAGASGNWVIAFHDAAGEVWRDLASLDPGNHPRMLRYLDLIGSVVFAIDGERVLEGLDLRERADRGVASPRLRYAETHELNIAEALARRLRARGAPTPVAVTLTKADLLWDRPEWSLFRAGSGATREAIDEAVRELFRRSGRKALLETLETSFAPLAFFAVSAFGRRPAPDLRVEDLRPSRVEEPLLALLGVPV